MGVGPIDFYLTENGADIAAATPQATVDYRANSALFDVSASTTAQIRAYPAGNKTDLLFDSGVTLNAIVNAVNQVGAAPGDLVAILEALKQAGALRAQLIVI